jgi:predicted DNA-binding transcriptional regulator AlpA
VHVEDNSMESTGEYLRVEQAAAYVGMSAASLYCYRSRRVGPRSLKVGGRVLYRRADLDEWIERSAVVRDATIQSA